jgi:glutathione S-transferase
MKLYFAPRTRASRSRWLLEELGIPYELVRLDLSKQENLTPEFLAVSPLGELPALIDGAVTILEPAAICLYLADRFPEMQLAPPLGSSERGAYLQWLLFAEVTLQPVVMRFHQHAQLSEAHKSTARVQEVLAKDRVGLDAVLDVVDAEVAGRDFLAAGHFTAADLVMAAILHLANHLQLLEERPRLVSYVRLHCERPACARAVS